MAAAVVFGLYLQQLPRRGPTAAAPRRPLARLAAITAAVAARPTVPMAARQPLRLSHPAFDTRRKQVFVTGNEAADVDSLVSAFVAAALLDSAEVEGVPVAQIPREEFRLRGDALSLFKRAGSELAEDGSPARLRFWDEVDWEAVKALERRALVLTDHNKMTPQVAAVFDPQHVEAILDHHADAGAYPEAKRHLDARLGSACTLVVEQFASASRAVPSELGTLLAGVIILDCRNWDVKENKGTPRDRASLDLLAPNMPEMGQDAWYHELTEARKDVSHLGIRELLVLDMKVAVVGGFSGSVAFSAMFASLDECVQMAGGAAALLSMIQAFAQEGNYDAVVLNLKQDGDFKGLLVVPTSEAQEALVEAVVTRLAGAPGNLPKELRDNPLYAAQGIVDEGFGLQARPELAPLRGFRMRAAISRKTLLPRVTSAALADA